MSLVLAFLFVTSGMVFAETVEIVSYKKGTYTGEMVNGQPNGEGHYVDDEIEVTGHYCNGLLHGKGVMIILRTGTRFEGNFVHGSLNGQGVRIRKSDRYVGNFVDTRFDGYGEFYYSNGGYYKGNFKEGLFMVMANFTWLVLVRIKGNMWTIIEMDMVKCIGKMEMFLKVHMLTMCERGMELLSHQKGGSMKVNL
jgi:hypothetical protein